MYQITKEQYTNKLKNLYPMDDFSVIDFVNAKSPVTIICNSCKQIFHYNRGTTLYSSRRKHLCSLCNSQTILKMKKACAEQNISIIKPSQNVTSYWEMQCNKCQHIFARVPARWQQLSCPNCGNAHNCYSKEERQKMIDEIFGAGEFEVLSDGAATRHFLIRHKCGFIRKTQFSAFIHSRGCPKCSQSMSKGERKILDYLENNHVQYIYQKKMGDTKQTFDFFLPIFNTAIEYNGEQHYKPIKTFGGEERFLQQQAYDTNKVIYCKENNITLKIISYLEFNNIDTISNDFFKKFNDQS